MMTRTGRARPWLRRLGCAVALLSGLAVLLGADGAAGEGAGAEAQRKVLLLSVDGAIGPATTHYLTSGFDYAAEQGHALIVLKLDTPGGLTAATRDIVKAMRQSTVPVAVWVAPAGARAASAGTYMLYASHIAAMAPATNVGAATPVSIGGGGAPGGQPGAGQGESSGDGSKGNGDKAASEGRSQGNGNQQPDSAKKRKAVNDAAAWIRGLAQETGRNADWAERAVREGASLTAAEAIERNVADLRAANITDLLALSHGREVSVAGTARALEVEGARVESRDPDWRSQFLSVITNPTVAYLLMMVGLYGLLLEGYNPGSFVPGIVGGICLLIAVYAFQILPVNYVGLLLIALGIILIVAEAFAPSFGVLGIGGVVAMVIGSIVLMDTDVPGFQIALEAIGATALFASLILAAIIGVAVRAWRRPVVSGAEGVERAVGEVLQRVTPEAGIVRLQGERWSARSDEPIDPGRRVRVVTREGLMLRVEPQSEQQE
jgi:membrane-bound serine protease (ClpP class)